MGLIEKVGTRLRRDAGISIERTNLYRRRSSDPAPRPIESDVEIAIGLIEYGQIDSLVALGHDDREDWRMRLDRGERCYAAWSDSQLVHYSWVQTEGSHPIAPAGIEIAIHPDDLWIYNCRTSECHRGKKIYPRVLQHILGDYFDAGADSAWIYTAADNVASQRGVLRAGFFLNESLRAIRFGRRYRPLSADAETEPA